MHKLEVVDAGDPQLAGFFAHGWEPPQEVVASVRAILADVRARGNAALLDYARRFDDPGFELRMLRVPIPSLQDSARLVSPEIARALGIAKERVARFHEHQRRADIVYEEPDGTQYAYRTRPLDAVAAYVPGGSATLPSTAIMTVVPAKLAGVARVVVLTPPQRDGGVHPAVLYACALCGADELYAVGGAQAIAAAAYGTASIAPVDKIVGPGNVWVTEAKRQVFGVVGIDVPAGPSEVLVVADEQAEARAVAAELLAQAEHDRNARVAALSQSRAILEATAEALVAGGWAERTRSAIIEEVMRDRCRLLHAKSFEQLCETIERFAPEHLALRVADPDPVLARVRHVGAVFVGASTPVACGDYLAGTNHVLPTSGAARYASGLSLADFTRSFAVVRNSEQRLRDDAPAIAALANLEGLEQHAATVLPRE